LCCWSLAIGAAGLSALLKGNSVSFFEEGIGVLLIYISCPDFPRKSDFFSSQTPYPF